MLQGMTESDDYYFIDTPQAVENLCSLLQGESWLAVDTEFLRESTYFPKLCLLQIATRQHVACIDVLALSDLEPVLKLLYDRNITKVMHAARQDLEIFYHLRGDLPQPVFDTQLGALLLGHVEQISYASLVEAMLDIHLNKAHTRADWSHRPLTAAQLRYAADDVRYLAQLYPVLRDKLEKMGRLTWLAEDFTALTEPSQYDRLSDQVWLRVRGAQHLRGHRLAILQALADWRERTARANDQPRNWLLRDETLLDIAKMQPADKTALLRIRGINARIIHNYGEGILSIIEASKNHKPAPLQAEHTHSRLTVGQTSIVELLLAAVSVISEQNALNPSIVASRKELERLVQGDQTVNVLHGWRRKLAGESLLAVLRGDAALRVVEGAVQIRGAN